MQRRCGAFLALVIVQLFFLASAAVTEYKGTIVYSLKSNTAIKGPEDFKGKKIGLAHINSGSFFLVKEITFYGNGYADQLNHVLMGKIDVGFTGGTFLMQKFPDQIPNLAFHNVLNVTYESEPYPFPTSTPVTPTFTLACSQQIPFPVKKAILAALMDLDPNSPQAKAAGLSNFTPAASMFDVRRSMEHGGLFTLSGRCYSPFSDMSKMMKCPRGYVVDTPKGLQQRCAANKLSCPPGYPCYCSPCVPTIFIALYPAEVVLGLATTLFCLNLVLIVFWGFGLEVGGCLRRPAHALASRTRSAWRWRHKAVPKHV